MLDLEQVGPETFARGPRGVETHAPGGGGLESMPDLDGGDKGSEAERSTSVAKLISEDSSKSLVTEMKANVKELLQEQYDAYMVKVEQGMQLQRDVLSRLTAIQSSLAGASSGGASSSTSAPTKTRRRCTVAALLQERHAAATAARQSTVQSSSESCAFRSQHQAPAMPVCAPVTEDHRGTIASKDGCPVDSPSATSSDEEKGLKVAMKSCPVKPSRPSANRLATESVVENEPGSVKRNNDRSDTGGQKEGDREVRAPLEMLAAEARRKRGMTSRVPKLPAELWDGSKGEEEAAKFSAPLKPIDATPTTSDTLTTVDDAKRKSTQHSTLCSETKRPSHTSHLSEAVSDESVARGTLARATTCQSLATGKPVRKTAVKKARLTRNDTRKSLIMSPKATGNDKPLGRTMSATSIARPSLFRNFRSVLPGDGDDDESEEHMSSSDDSDGPAARRKRKQARLRSIRRSRENERSIWKKMVQHPAFDFASGFLIVSSTVSAGAETNWMAENEGQSTVTYFALRMLFLTCFAVELMIRMLGAGIRGFFSAKDSGWNIFDFLMVGSSFVELAIQFALSGSISKSSGGSSGRILRILRIVRISRALRLGRILRYARTFRQIVYSLQSSVGTLFWAMVMIFLVVYCFAICFCQAFSEYMLDRDELHLSPRMLQELTNSYSSLPKSLYSLFMAMTGGRSWGELLEPLMLINGIYTVLFVLFISLTYFGVLNVVAAIFVESAMQSQQHYKDLLIQENVEKKEVYSQHLREVFHEIDRDGSGYINGDEMEFFLADPSLNLYLESIDIFPNDARSLFRLLDRDASGEVSIEEFCQGCLRLKGEAKSFDIHCLIYANDRSQRKLDKILSWLCEAVPVEN